MFGSFGEFFFRGRQLKRIYFQVNFSVCFFKSLSLVSTQNINVHIYFKTHFIEKKKLPRYSLKGFYLFWKKKDIKYSI